MTEFFLYIFVICKQKFLITGIYGHQRESPTGDLAYVSSDLDDSSTEQYLFLNSDVTDSSTDATWFTSSTENPVTLDPHPSWKPSEREFYIPIRDSLKQMANSDFQLKMVFDFHNRPSELRHFIDGVFYSIKRYRKDMVEGRSSSAYEIYPGNDYSQVSEDQIKKAIDQEMELLTEDLNKMFKPEQSQSADDMTNDPAAETGMNVNTDGALDRSGLLLQMAQEVSSQTEHSPTITADALVDIPPEESSNQNLESDIETPIVTTSDTLGEVPKEDSTENPEDVSDGTKHFIKDWSLMRFPPIKTKTMVYTKTDDSVRKPYDVPVSQVLEPKLAKTSEQAEYKAAVASQAVEGALGLAETIARETAYFVNRITMEALRQNVDKPKFKTVNSVYKIADPGVKHKYHRESLL